MRPQNLELLDQLGMLGLQCPPRMIPKTHPVLDEESGHPVGACAKMRPAEIWVLGGPVRCDASALCAATGQSKEVTGAIVALRQPQTPEAMSCATVVEPSVCACCNGGMNVGEAADSDIGEAAG